MKKVLLSLSVCGALAFGSTNEELLKELHALKQQVEEMKTEQAATNEAILEELSQESYKDAKAYESFSSMGGAASKVYYGDEGLSMGGYAEYYYKKYNGYKNSDSETTNKAKNMGVSSILRFIPYIGYKFNDNIIMNTEIEFEDGGARSDGEKEYKYAIVEFSYLDFLFSQSFNVRVGHILTPMGLTNLNHEPTSFLTADRPEVESIIIPSTWHTNGILAHGTFGNFEYYAGVVTSPDADTFGEEESKFIKDGRLGAKQYSDSFSFVSRATYDFESGLNIGGSILYGSSKGFESDAKVSIFMTEAHAQYKNNGFNIQALATYATLGGDTDKIEVGSYSDGVDYAIAESVNGQYMTLGYDVLSFLNMGERGYLVGEIERLDMDAKGQTTYVENNRFMEYSTGFAYYPDPRVVFKGDYKLRDYKEAATLADEKSFTLALGYIY